MLVKIYTENPSEKEIDRVVNLLERDGVVIYPTDSVYAFGCSIRSAKAVERLRRIKGKDLTTRLARQLDADSAELMRALTDPQLAREVGTDSLQLFSIFIPNTYEFYWTVSPEDFVRRMRKEYDRFWTPERDAARRRSGLSRDEVMTLASIVTEETNKADEMPRVAGVYINRLRKGMPLQADPTVKYALQDFSLRRILHKHLRTPSPYNTYLNKGLPPSSIAMPSVAAIDGVLNFENHDYLFFCARPTFDGYHSFARTYGEHLANARAYSAELNRRNIK